MANVRNGSLREIIIDRCLKSRRGYSTYEIMEKCNEALKNHGELPITASNTIRNDLLSIENRWNIVIEQLRDGRNVKYRYEDPTFSIYNTPFNEDEINSLKQSISVLKRFEGMTGFEWVNEMNAHIQSSLNFNTQAFVGFDSNQLLKGMEFFTPLFNFISNHKAITLSYKPYSTDSTSTFIIHPYFLKEYNQRWFLFAYNEEFKSLSNFALDRIIAIKESSVKYIENTKYDFNHYFDNLIGVSIKPNFFEEEVVLRVSKEQWKYTSSKPLHSSQRLLETNNDGSVLVAIKVRPNFELIQLILSFGDRLNVLKPIWLKEKIIEIIKNNLENYNRFI